MQGGDGYAAGGCGILRVDLLSIYQFYLLNSMKVVIIEDEVPAAARLEKMLGATAYGIEVMAVSDTYLVSSENSAGFKKWLGR